MTTRALARFVHELSYERLPPEVRERVPALALDLAGIMVRARHEAESTPAMIAAARRLGLAQGACTVRSEEHTSELQSLMRISYDVFCLKTKKPHNNCTD